MSVSRIAAWQQEDDFDTNGLNYTPPAGDRRCAVLIVGGEENGSVQSGPMSISSATLGGQACVVQSPATLQAGTDGGYHNTVSIITLNEAGIAAMSGNAFVVTWVNFDGTGLFETSPVCHYATFQDVDQANINSANQSNTQGSNVNTLSPSSTMDVAVDELVIAVNICGQPFPSPSSSAGGLSEQTEYIGAANDMSMAVYERTALTADASYTFTMDNGGSSRMIVVGMALGFDAGGADETASGAPTIQAITSSGVATQTSVAHEQDSFRYYVDGTESGAAELENQNVDLTIDKETTFGIRVGSQIVANPPAISVTLEYKKTGDPDAEFRKLT